MGGPIWTNWTALILLFIGLALVVAVLVVAFVLAKRWSRRRQEAADRRQGFEVVEAQVARATAEPGGNP